MNRYFAKVSWQEEECLENIVIYYREIKRKKNTLKTLTLKVEKYCISDKK